MLNDDLLAIDSWAKQWLVNFCPPKTETLIVSNKRNIDDHPPLYLNGQVIKEDTEHKHVGVILDRTHSWHKHIDCIYLRLTKLMY